MKLHILLVVASAALLSAFPASASALTYQIADLGSLAGAPTFATEISDNGIVAGCAQPTETSSPSKALENQPTRRIP